jgi:hypothetical protein
MYFLFKQNKTGRLPTLYGLAIGSKKFRARLLTIFLIFTMENSSAIDRISNLPNDILCHILSFLPTKLAFTTTVLSKRWKLPLFKLLTTFHFDDESFSNKMTFPRFIDIVMLFALPIKTFHLKCNSIQSYSFNRWIKSAKLHSL